MSFVTSAALAVGLLVALPMIAHLLHRGRVRRMAFPPARLVQASESTSRRHAHLDDRSLLLLRVAMVLGLALLGAAPLVRCNTPGLERPHGGNVALVVVLDDSMSMGTTMQDGRTRFEAARSVASQLVDGLRPGDAVALVLAGRPARLLLPMTTDANTASQQLADVTPSDRGTDLTAALALAQDAVHEAPQPTHPIALLSDFASSELVSLPPDVITPAPFLTEPQGNCGIVQARWEAGQVVVRVQCTQASVATGRRLTLQRSAPPKADANLERAAAPQTLSSVGLEAKAGPQTLTLAAPEASALYDVLLTPQDALARDDWAAASSAGAERALGIVMSTDNPAERHRGSLVERALRALAPDARLLPMTSLPDTMNGLDTVGLLVLDDPTGLQPEQRDVLSRWLQRGGVVVGLLGAHVAQGSLGADLEPLLRGAVHWEPQGVPGLTREGIAPWLAESFSGMDRLNPKGRVLLPSATEESSRTEATWSDGRPFIVLREVGMGRAWLVGLPSSVDISDFALRPAFLELLSHAKLEADRLGATGSNRVGEPWTLPSSAEVFGARGARVTLRSVDASHGVFVPSEIGRYWVGGTPPTPHTVFADEAEVTTQPSERASREVTLRAAATAPRPQDVSRQVALVLLLLLTGELGLRALGLRQQARTPS